MIFSLQEDPSSPHRNHMVQPSPDYGHAAPASRLAVFAPQEGIYPFWALDPDRIPSTAPGAALSSYISTAPEWQCKSHRKVSLCISVHADAKFPRGSTCALPDREPRILRCDILPGSATSSSMSVSTLGFQRHSVPFSPRTEDSRCAHPDLCATHRPANPPESVSEAASG